MDVKCRLLCAARRNELCNVTCSLAPLVNETDAGGRRERFLTRERNCKRNVYSDRERFVRFFSEKCASIATCQTDQLQEETDRTRLRSHLWIFDAKCFWQMSVVIFDPVQIWLLLRTKVDILTAWLHEILPFSFPFTFSWELAGS